MNWNKLVTETRGEAPKKVECSNCNGTGTGPRVNGRPDLHGCMRCLRRGYNMELTDYEGSMDACMELWEEADLYDLCHETDSHGPKGWLCSWVFSRPELEEYRDGGYQDTPQLAIITAYLKSKGVATDIAECEACPASRGCEEYLGSDYCNERRNQND